MHAFSVVVVIKIYEAILKLCIVVHLRLSTLVFFIMGEYRHELYFIRGVEGGGGHTMPNRGYFPDCHIDPHALFYLM